MADSYSETLAEVSDALDTAVRLASQGRYGELTAHAAAVEQAAAALDQLKRDLETDASTGGPLRESSRRIRRKVSTLSEVMRHAAVVQAGLLQVEGSVADNYNRRGAFAPGQAGPRGRRLVNEEA